MRCITTIRLSYLCNRLLKTNHFVGVYYKGVSLVCVAAVFLLNNKQRCSPCHKRMYENKTLLFQSESSAPAHLPPVLPSILGFAASGLCTRPNPLCLPALSLQRSTSIALQIRCFLILSIPATFHRESQHL